MSRSIPSSPSRSRFRLVVAARAVVALAVRALSTLTDPLRSEAAGVPAGKPRPAPRTLRSGRRRAGAPGAAAHRGGRRRGGLPDPDRPLGGAGQAHRFRRDGLRLLRQLRCPYGRHSPGGGTFGQRLAGRGLRVSPAADGRGTRSRRHGGRLRRQRRVRAGRDRRDGTWVAQQRRRRGVRGRHPGGL